MQCANNTEHFSRFLVWQLAKRIFSAIVCTEHTKQHSFWESSVLIYAKSNPSVDAHAIIVIVVSGRVVYASIDLERWGIDAVGVTVVLSNASDLLGKIDLVVFKDELLGFLDVDSAVGAAETANDIKLKDKCIIEGSVRLQSKWAGNSI